MAAAPPGGSNVRRFNCVCAVVALLWLSCFAFLRQVRHPWDVQDLAQYYMGGLVARLGEWPALYPDPYPASPMNAGWWEGSAPKPSTERLARQYHASTSPRFIQLPVTAVLISWLSWFRYSQAVWPWLALQVAAGWGTAVMAAKIVDFVAGGPTRWSGLVILLVASSPLMYRGCRALNVSPIVAYCIGAVVLDVLRGKWLRGGVAMILGSLLKYVPLILIVVARKNRRMLVTALAAALVSAVICVAVGRGQPMDEFIHRIAPTLTRSSTNPANQTLQGMLLRLYGVSVLSQTQMVIFQILRFGVLLALLSLILFKAPSAMTTIAASAALVAWMIIFGPVAWEHYYVYFCPFWGWLAWEIMQATWRRYAAIAVLSAHWFPWPMIRGPIASREPIASVMFFGAVLILVMAVSRLRSQAEYAQAANAGETPVRGTITHSTSPAL